MIESPLITELLAKRTQEAVVTVLKRRFGKVPPDIVKHLRAVLSEKKLNQLLGHAVDCPGVEAFRDVLLS
jgi:hypothetical protein